MQINEAYLHELIDFTDMTSQQRSEVLEWRNHESVRNSSHNREIISAEDHVNFINGLKGDNTRLYFYVESDEGGIGVFSLTDITVENAVYGCYKNPDFDKKGTGTEITKLAAAYARETLGLMSLNVEVYLDNPASLRMFEKNGYKETGRTNDLVKMRLDF